MSNWYLQNGKESDVVISTRIRLARNIKDFRFPNKYSKEESKKILEKNRRNNSKFRIWTEIY